MTNEEKDTACLNAIKSINLAAQALKHAATLIFSLQKEINKPDIHIVDTKV